MLYNQWHIGEQEHETIYGDEKNVCLEQNISIGSYCTE